MKSSFKKLTVVITAMCFFIAVKAQIVYTDVKPDSVISANQSYNLDLNNDGIADFKITDSAWTVHFGVCGSPSDVIFKITPLHNDAVELYALQANNAVASDLSWVTAPNQILREIEYQCVHSRWDNSYHLVQQSFGYWGNISGDGYLGLKLIKGNNIYYGWVRIAGTTIKDCAYNSVVGQPILAGQKTYFNWVVTDSLTPVKNLYCQGDSLKVKFTALGIFQTSNVFKAQLSDSAGHFANAVTIGSIKSTGAVGIINAKIPGKTLNGAHYRIRVVSSQPFADSLYGIKTGITIGAAIAVAKGAPTAFCEGQNNYTYLDAPFGYTYQWLKNGKKIIGETSYNLQVSTSGNYSCVITTCGNDTSNTIHITVYPTPKAIVVALGPAAFCKSGNVTLKDTVDDEWWTYSWFGPDGLISGATKPSYTAKASGFYGVIVTTSKGCNSQSDYSKQIYVSVANAPAGSMQGATTFCANWGDNILLEAVHDYLDHSYQYQWKMNGQNIAGATNEFYYVQTSGTYTCIMTNACGSITPPALNVTAQQCLNFAAVNTTSNEKIISKSVQLKVVPNPVSNSTTISFNLPQSQKVSVTIYDMNGRLIKTLADTQMQQGPHQLTWNARSENVIAGNYLLKLQAGNNIVTRKLFIVH